MQAERSTPPSKRRSSPHGATVLGLCLVAAIGCGGSDLVLPSDIGATALTAMAGTGQSGTAGQELADPLVVKVTDAQGQPVSGARVAFAPDAAAGGSISPDTVRTKGDGLASVSWVLGGKAGSQTATATIVGQDGNEALSDGFTASAAAAPARSLALISGDNQSAPAGSPLSDPLVVIVTDGFGNAVEGVNVSWDAQGGSVNPGSTTTGADGHAATSRVLGASAGIQHATASVRGLDGSPVTFTHTATPGTASTLVVVSGNNQTGPPGSTLPAPLVVRLADSQGNPIAGASVTWAVETGGGSIQPGGDTGADGQASATFTLGPTPGGSNTASATVSGVGVIQFTATSATTLTIVAGDGQTASAGSRVATAPSVRVTNDLGQGVAGFGVTFVVTGGNGSVTGASQTTNSNGFATVGSWTLGDPGTNTLEARATGLNGSPAVFSATANDNGGGDGGGGGGDDSDHLIFQVQPASPQQADRDFSPPVVVTIVDVAGNVVPSNAEVRVSVVPALRLKGHEKRKADGGVAVFDDLRIKDQGTGFVLTATVPQRPELGQATSNSFAVNPK